MGGRFLSFRNHPKEWFVRCMTRTFPWWKYCGKNTRTKVVSRHARPGYWAVVRRKYSRAFGVHDVPIKADVGTAWARSVARCKGCEANQKVASAEHTWSRVYDPAFLCKVFMVWVSCLTLMFKQQWLKWVGTMWCIVAREKGSC